MDRIQTDLITTFGSGSNNGVKVFTRNEAATVAGKIRELFGDPRNRSDPLWESLNETQAYHAEEAITQIKQRLMSLHTPLLLLIDDWHGYSAIEISSGPQLWALLDQSYGFRYYITNPSLTFVLCKNDHDVLLVCGDASPKTSE